MTWILILTLTGSVGAVEFVTEDACERARKHWEATAKDRVTVRSAAICFPKG